MTRWVLPSSEINSKASSFRDAPSRVTVCKSGGSSISLRIFPDGSICFKRRRRARLDQQPDAV